MNILQFAFAIAVAALSHGAFAQTGNYKHTGELPASGHIANQYYAFDYIPPNTTYNSVNWNAYVDKDEKRNTVLVIGLSGYDTYALSVLYSGQAKQEQYPIDVAQKKYTSASFSVIEANPACVSTPTDKPMQVSGRMNTFLAICIDKSSKAIYELGFSWQSIMLSLQSIDEIVNESNKCVANKLKDPQTLCLDRIGNYAASYKAFLSSFSATGK